MTKRVRITNADASPYGLIVRHSSGEVKSLAQPGDDCEFHLSGSQTITITEEVPFASTPADGPPAGTVSPQSIGLFQNDSSRKHLPGVWLYSTTQLQGKHDLPPDVVDRIMLNCGCDAEGGWHDGHGNPTPAAHRGFEQADTNAERARLERFNATPRVFEIKHSPVLGRNILNEGRHVAIVAAIPPAGKNPPVYAVRAIDARALDEWCEYMAVSRTNPGA